MPWVFIANLSLPVGVITLPAVSLSSAKIKAVDNAISNKRNSRFISCVVLVVKF